MGERRKNDAGRLLHFSAGLILVRVYLARENPVGLRHQQPASIPQQPTGIQRWRGTMSGHSRRTRSKILAVACVHPRC